MCESYDVLKSTYQSAPTMTYTFCDYGGGSMGYGIRKFADEVSLKVEQIFDEIPAQLQKHEKKI